MKPSRSVGGISSFLRFTERTYRFFGSKQEPAGFLFREKKYGNDQRCMPYQYQTI